MHMTRSRDATETLRDRCAQESRLIVVSESCWAYQLEEHPMEQKSSLLFALFDEETGDILVAHPTKKDVFVTRDHFKEGGEHG